MEKKRGLSKGFMQFCIRFVVLVLLAYLIIPNLIVYISSMSSLEPRFSLNYTYFAMFTVGLIVVFLLYNKDEILKLKAYKQDINETLIFSAVSLCMFVLYFIILYTIKPLFVEEHFFFVLTMSYLTYALGFIFLGLMIFNYYFFKKFIRSILASFLVAIVFFNFVLILMFNWRFFSGWVTRLSYYILRLTFSDVVMDLSASDPLLAVGDFSIYIGSPCSGIVSLGLFTSLFIAITAFDWKLMRKDKLLPMFFGGLFGMYAMSIVRIYGLMVIGALISEELAMSLFHANAGWILFVIYLLTYWYFGYPYLTKKRKDLRKNS